jgi:hypothetical protein
MLRTRKLTLYISLVLLTLNSVTPALPDPNFYFQIKNKDANVCLSLVNPKSFMYFQSCSDPTLVYNQQFKVTAVGNNYSITLRDPAYNLDLAVGATNIVNWPAPTQAVDTQQWKFISVGVVNSVEYFQIQNVNTGKCIKYTAADNTAVQDTCSSTDSTFAFGFVRVKATVAGYITDSGTNALVPNGILSNANTKITFKNPDGTTVGTATIDATNGKYSMSVTIDTTYTVKVEIPGYITSNNGADLTIQVQGKPLDATADASITSTAIAVSKIPTKNYTWKLQLSWTSTIKDLDIYIKSDISCFYYGKPTSALVNILGNDIRNFDAQRSTYEEIDLLPTTTGNYVVYVKNYSRDGLLKDSGAKITIKKSSVTNGVTTNEADEAFAINSAVTDVKKVYWKAFTIDATTQTYTTHNQVCLDPMCS